MHMHVQACVFHVGPWVQVSGDLGILSEWMCRMRASTTLFTYVGLRGWGPMNLGKFVCLGLCVLFM